MGVDWLPKFRKLILEAMEIARTKLFYTILKLAVAYIHDAR